MAQTGKKQSLNGKKTLDRAPVKKKNKWLMPCGITAIIAVVIIMAIVALISGGGGGGTGATSGGGNTAVIKDANLVILVSEISTTAKFYPVEVDGTKLEVLAVEAPDGSIRTAFNTCQVCYGSGRGYYMQDGNVLVCQNCGNRFRMDQIEVVSGGCNPVPIFPENKTLTDETITILKDFLIEAKVIFENWKVE